MEAVRLSQLLDEYFDCNLTAADKLELEHLLLQYPAARATFWRRAEWEAMMHQWGEQHWGAEGLKLLPPVPHRRGLRWAMVGLAAAALALAALFLRPRDEVKPEPHAQESVAVLRYASAPQWAGGMELSPGDALPDGAMKLVRGFVTVELSSGAQVSIEAPAEWTVTGVNSLRLQVGRTTAQVPARAAGFRIETPVGDVVDFGTTFGVNVLADGTTATHVFEGKVELRSGGTSLPLSRGMALSGRPGAITFTSREADPRLFPSPERQLGNVLAGGGFEPGVIFMRGSMPTRTGEWRGDVCELVEQRDGVAPREGKLMLKFVRADNGEAPDRAVPRTGAELWQLVDVRELRRRAGTSGPLAIEASAAFNSGQNRSGRFGLKLVAWHGAMRHVKQAWTQSLAAPEVVVGTTQSRVTTDRDPRTWEMADATLTLPPEADHLVVALMSFADAPADFPANFADDVTLRVSAPPEPSLLAHP